MGGFGSFDGGDDGFDVVVVYGWDGVFFSEGFVENVYGVVF